MKTTSKPWALFHTQGFVFVVVFYPTSYHLPTQEAFLLLTRKSTNIPLKSLNKCLGQGISRSCRNISTILSFFTAPYLPVTLCHTTEIVLLSLAFKNSRRFTVLYILFWFYMIIQIQETFSLLNSLVSPFLTFPGTLPLISPLTILLQSQSKRIDLPSVSHWDNWCLVSVRETVIDSFVNYTSSRNDSSIVLCKHKPDVFLSNIKVLVIHRDT